MSAGACDVLVVGGGVVGVSIAFHLAQLGARNVRLVERDALGAGTTAQSSCIVRTHYSVPENVALAKAALAAFRDFPGYVGDAEADCGWNRCGYLIVAPEGSPRAAVQASLAAERAQGIEAREIGHDDARRILPLLALDDIACIGWTPEAGYADAYLTLSAFARAARRLGVHIGEGIAATGLVRAGTRVTGVESTAGRIDAGTVICAQNIWTGQVAAWTGIALPLAISRHAVFTLEGPVPYGRDLPILKDLASASKLYLRSYGGRQLLVGDGNEGEMLSTPDTGQADVSLDHVVTLGQEVARRLPAFAEAGLAASWTGVYDVTPDWNPVLGAVPGIDGLLVAYGFSGHGFKLSPIVGRLLAQAALGLPTDLDLAPYALTRFAGGRLLAGRYGAGAVS
jgi:glycine/D-amino acid oxidase-like deaminating enzyme